MTRAWNALVAALADLTPGGVVCLALSLLLLAGLVAGLWYTWPPTWLLPRRRRGGGAKRRARWRRPLWRRLRWPDWRRWRWRLPRWRLRWWRRRRPDTPVPPAETGPDEVPQVPAADLALAADQLAAAGRYAEALRERLRSVVRALIEGQVIAHRPGWTVTELAAAAGRARPAVAQPLREAVLLFSDVWYGQRPAGPPDDAAMRHHAALVQASLAGPAPQPPGAADGPGPRDGAAARDGAGTHDGAAAREGAGLPDGAAR